MKGVGIFYETFCLVHGQYPLCQMVWYRGCYIEHPKDNITKSGKESGGDWERELESIYEEGRTGDHILTHFQCDLCHFQNMKGRYPNGVSLED